MRGEIIAIGDELTSGRIVNTTSGFAARQLHESGYEIYAMHTIGDTPQLIGEALKRAIGRVDFVIVTGGLGATDDDLTNLAVSHALERPTVPNLEILSIIRAHLDEISASPVSQLEKLAWLPKGADPFDPQARMAGYRLIHQKKPIFFLPGIPEQMHRIMMDHVVPQLATWQQEQRFSTHQRLFKICGLNEMQVNEIMSSIPVGDSIRIGYYEVWPEVHLSVIVRDVPENNPEQQLEEVSTTIEQALGEAIFAIDQQTMASVVGALLSRAGLTLAVAESCTGGLISSQITAVSGSSEYYLGGVTSYANAMKEKFLHVDKVTLEKYGAVSSQVAAAMAWGMRETSKADIAISVTGIAGPGGGSDEKPVGTVFIGFSSRWEEKIEQFLFRGNRQQIQAMTAQIALDQVRRFIIQQKKL